MPKISNVYNPSARLETLIVLFLKFTIVFLDFEIFKQMVLFQNILDHKKKTLGSVLGCHRWTITTALDRRIHVHFLK